MFDQTDDARRLLAEENLTDLVVTRSTAEPLRYDFVGRREEMLCRGNLTFDDRFNTNIYSTRISCGTSIEMSELESMCENEENGEACELASSVLRGAAPVDFVRMTHFAARACERDRPRACFHVGVAQERGERGLPQNLNLAFVNYTRACDGGEPVGCFNAGLMRYRGEGSLLQRDVGCQLLSRSCDLGYLRGCGDLGQCRRAGHGGPRDFASARELLTRACNGDIGISCRNLGSMYELGQGVEQSDPQAFVYYTRSCARDYEGGCYAAALLQIRGRGPLPSRAVGARVMARLCDGGDISACNEIGVALHEGPGDIRADRPRAYPYFQTACEGGSAAGCRNVGVYLREGLGNVPRDRAQARAFFERSCQLGNERACTDARALR